MGRGPKLAFDWPQTSHQWYMMCRTVKVMPSSCFAMAAVICTFSDRSNKVCLMRQLVSRINLLLSFRPFYILRFHFLTGRLLVLSCSLAWLFGHLKIKNQKLETIDVVHLNSCRVVAIRLLTLKLWTIFWTRKGSFEHLAFLTFPVRPLVEDVVFIFWTLFG